jgi:hypothetical protein
MQAQPRLQAAKSQQVAFCGRGPIVQSAKSRQLPATTGILDIIAVIAGAPSGGTDDFFALSSVRPIDTSERLDP